MGKDAYLQQLEQLLYNIPAQDREEALQFYIDYLEDAGPEAEEEVLRSLGTPEELAESIRQALYGDNPQGDYTRVYKDLPGTYRTPFSEGGRFSGKRDAGYDKYEESSYDNHSQYDTHTQNVTGNRTQSQKGRMSAGQWILMLILLVCAAPIIVPVCGAVLGVIMAVIGVLFAVLIALGVGGVGLLVAAIVVIVVAIVKLVFTPLSSLIMLGGGLLMIGIGLIGMAIAAWMVSKVIPTIFKGTVSCFSRIFTGKRY